MRIFGYAHPADCREVVCAAGEGARRTAGGGAGATFLTAIISANEIQMEEIIPRNILLPFVERSASCPGA
jgi:hypothetical protein